MSSSNLSASNGATVTKGTNVTNSTSATPQDSTVSTARQASSAWLGFEDALKEVSKYSQMFSQIEIAMDRHSAMELETQTKDIRIATLESSYGVQIEEFGKCYNKWEGEKSQLERELANVKTEVTVQAQGILEKRKTIHAREIGDVKKELEAERKKVATLTRELERTNAKTQRIETDLNHYIKQLKEWECYISLLNDVDFKAFDGRLKQLFTRCCKIVRTCFLRDLPAEILLDQARWKTLPRSLNVTLSFPPTNSPAAKHTRMAAALHVIASQLCINFFKPCYIPESAIIGEKIKEILFQQFTTDMRKERITRALLLSTYTPKEIKEAINRAVHETSREILKLLGPIGGGEETFRRDIEALLYEAADVWKEAQYSKKKVEVSMTDDDSESWPWAQLDEFTSAVSEAKEQPVLRSFNMLALFPRVFVPEDDYIVNSGFVLWPDQNIVVTAEQELSQYIAAKSVKGGRSGNNSSGSRRLSGLNDGRNGVRPEVRAPFLEAQRV